MVSGFGTVARALFLEPGMRALSDAGWRLTTYALAGLHSNIIGAFFAPDGYIAGDLGWSFETVSQTVSEVCANGIVKRFGGGEYLIVPRFFEWNTIRNGNVLKAAIKQVEALPADPVILSILNGLEPFAKQFGNDFPNQVAALRKRKTEPAANTLPYPTLSELSPARGMEQQGWEDIWAAFRLVPGFAHEDDATLAAKVWARRGGDWPTSSAMVACIGEYARSVATINSKRPVSAGKVFIPKPSNWMERNRGWEPFLAAATRTPVEVKCNALIEACGDRFAAFIDEIGGQDVFTGWFAPCDYSGGKLAAPSAFHVKWILDHFLPPLHKAVASRAVEVVCMRQGRAA